MEIHKKLDAEFFDATDLCIEDYSYGISETIRKPSDEKKLFVAISNETEFSVKKLMLNVFAKNIIAYEYFKQQGFEDMMYQMTLKME